VTCVLSTILNVITFKFYDVTNNKILHLEVGKSCDLEVSMLNKRCEIKIIKEDELCII